MTLYQDRGFMIALWHVCEGEDKINVRVCISKNWGRILAGTLLYQLECSEVKHPIKYEY